LADVPDSPNADTPDDTPDDNETPDGEGRDEGAEETGAWAVDPSVLDPFRERIAEMLAPIAEAAREQLAEVVEPVTRQIQAQIAALLPKIELPKIELPTLPTFKLPPEIVEALTRIRLRPPNWPDVADRTRLAEVIQDDGIPLVWVPRADIVAELLTAPDRAARIKVLIGRRDDVVEDCRAVLETVGEPYADKVQLALQAVDALAAGHEQAAQALATVVVESSTRLAIDESSTKVQNRVRVKLDDVADVEIRLRAALAPLDVFYKEWHGTKNPKPMPKALSRHVTCHWAEPDHFSEGNALVAVMLAASVLRALQELEELRAVEGNPTWLRK